MKEVVELVPQRNNFLVDLKFTILRDETGFCDVVGGGGA